MTFDALTMAAVADELREKIVGGRVQKVVQTDELSVSLEIYAHRQRCYLLASADPQQSRVYLTTTKHRRGVEQPTPLHLLLRKYVQGSHVGAVEWPEWDRVLHLHLEHPEGDTTLIIEIMGRYSNIVLVDEEGVILDCIKRVTPEMTRYRVLLPRQPYTPPPPQQKPAPPDLTELRLRDILAQVDPDTPVWRALVGGMRGISQQLAREITFRATGDAVACVAAVQRVSPLLRQFQELEAAVRAHTWEPTIVIQEGQGVTFAPYRLTHRSGAEPAESISAAVEAAFTTQIGRDPYAAARESLHQAIAEAKKRLQNRLRALESSHISEADIQQLRLSGEMILAYAATIAPDQKVLEAQTDLEGTTMTIVLDSELLPVENAQAYFARYEKAKRAAEEVPPRIAQTEVELAYLDQLENDLDLASDRPEIEEVRSALVEAGYLKASRRKAHPTMRTDGPRRVISVDGFEILVGRNSRQNEAVTFGRAAPDDLWLHARGVPGAHVIVKASGGTVPESTVRQAAALAAYYSRGRESAQVAVDVAQRRHVRRIKGGRPGMVTYRGERTINVAPRPERPTGTEGTEGTMAAWQELPEFP